MFHFFASGSCTHQDLLSADWGPFTRYVEVSEDQFVTRQVHVFPNGNVLRYDRKHWADDFGMLLGLRFSFQPKWRRGFHNVKMISAAEFEKVWKMAKSSNLWNLQLEHSRAAQWGTRPHWLLTQADNTQEAI